MPKKQMGKPDFHVQMRNSTTVTYISLPANKPQGTRFGIIRRRCMRTHGPRNLAVPLLTPTVKNSQRHALTTHDHMRVPVP
jgi:hypothetical protein